MERATVSSGLSIRVSSSPLVDEGIDAGWQMVAHRAKGSAVLMVEALWRIAGMADLLRVLHHRCRSDLWKAKSEADNPLRCRVYENCRFASLDGLGTEFSVRKPAGKAYEEIGRPNPLLPCALFFAVSCLGKSSLGWVRHQGFGSDPGRIGLSPFLAVCRVRLSACWP